jgi:hypothetical protein
VEVATHLLIAREGETRHADQPVRPLRGDLDRATEVTPIVGKPFDVRNLIGAVRLEEAVEPRGPCCRVGRRGGNGRNDLRDGDRLEILEESRGRRYIGIRRQAYKGKSVKHRRLGHRQGERKADLDLDGALEAMTAPELRAFVHAVLDELEDEQRAGILDSLMARAARGDAGWKPNRPSRRIVDNARSFADAARRVGYADPDDVSEHLRQATKAFLAGDHASARAVFQALLPPIAAVDIDLGQHELVEEVLGIAPTRAWPST